jgi:RNA recognition motif-containing protein
MSRFTGLAQLISHNKRIAVIANNGLKCISRPYLIRPSTLTVQRRFFAPKSFVFQENQERERAPRQYDQNSNNKIFVTNLSYETDWSQVREFFSQIGTVTFVKLFKSEDGKSLGRAVVGFEREEDRNAAVEQLNQKEFEGRTIKIRPYLSLAERPERRERAPFPDEETRAKRVFVAKLPLDINEDTLKAHMEKAGQVENVTIVRNRDGTPRGFGFVQYSTGEEAARAAAELNTSNLEDSVIEVRPDRPRREFQ